MSNDESQIREVVRQWHEASQAGDTAAVLALMTDDVVFLVPGRPPMSKADFAALSTMPPGMSRPTLRSTQEICEIAVVGDLAYMWTALEVAVTPPGATEALVRAGHTLTIFRKNDGRWLLARDANLLVARA